MLRKEFTPLPHPVFPPSRHSLENALRALVARVEREAYDAERASKQKAE